EHLLRVSEHGSRVAELAAEPLPVRAAAVPGLACRGGAMTSGREVARALRAAYLALHRQTNACFARDGVTADQFVLLAALADDDAVTQQELVRRVGSDPNTVRAMLLLLEGRGLVARARHPADGRARCVTLTAKGRQAFEKLWTKSEALRAR